MNLIKWILIKIVALLVISSPAWSLTAARLLTMSKSGQTAVFNLGIHDGVKEGDYAVIVKEIRDLSTRDLKVVPVAKARNIKINTGNSVWILYKFYDAELMVKGQTYLVLSETAMMSGRRDPRIGRISVVTEKEKAAFQTTQALSYDQDRLSKLKALYPEIQVLHEKEYRSDNDFDLYDVDIWKKYDASRYRTALYKSPYAQDFRRNLRLNTFEKLVTAYLLKVNDPTFSYDAFYDEQKKTSFSNEFKERSNFDTEYEGFLKDQSKKQIDDARFYRSVLEKGDSWSEDFSDEDLSRTLKNVSSLKEIDRRKFVLSDPNRYAVFLGYGMNFVDAQTTKDPGFRRENRFSVDFDFEVIPVLKHETLERITLNASFRSNRSALETENRNAAVDEVSIAAGINWYPLYSPYTIEAPAIFLGTYIRSGTASLEAPSVNEKANYTLITLPGFRGGMRYNFKNNVGLRVALSFEKLQLDRYEQSKMDSILPDQVELVEGKMNFAMAYSF